MLKTIKFPETKIGTPEHMEENPNKYERLIGEGIWEEVTMCWDIQELKNQIKIKNKTWNNNPMNNKIFYLNISSYKEIWRLK